MGLFLDIVVFLVLRDNGRVFRDVIRLLWTRVQGSTSSVVRACRIEERDGSCVVLWLNVEQ